MPRDIFRTPVFLLQSTALICDHIIGRTLEVFSTTTRMTGSTHHVRMMSPPSGCLSVDNGVDVSEGSCLLHHPPYNGQAGAGEPYAVDMYRSGPRFSTLQEGGRAEGSGPNTPSIEISPPREGNEEGESASNSSSPLRR